VCLFFYIKGKSGRGNVLKMNVKVSVSFVNTLGQQVSAFSILRVEFQDAKILFLKRHF